MSDDHAPTASWKILRRRAEMLEQLRRFFRHHAMLEVETPLLSHDTVIDRHLDPVPVRLGRGSDRGEDGDPMWLQTSPEFGMKRLLAAGAPSIYQVTRAFRRDEFGPLHNPEFTMVEWYRVGDSMTRGIEFLSQLAAEMLDRGAAESVSYRDAFLELAGVDPFRADVDQLRQTARRLELDVPEQWSRDDRDLWLDYLLTECVQPHLGKTVPVILYDYPAAQAALAVVREDDPPVAERFELYVDGIELANGYHELLDADVLRQRNEANNRLRRLDGKTELPEESRLLDAMRAGLPACTGVALGFDRLVMIAVGADRIEQVLAFPVDRA